MGKLKKDDAMYIMGMEHAWNVGAAAEPGKELDAIKNEITYRTGGNPLPLVANVSRQNMAELAREYLKPETHIMAVSLAWTLQEVMKLPANRIALFLKEFNDKICTYRHDEKVYEHDQAILNSNWNMLEVEEIMFKKGDKNA